ncbi:MAG: DivIVA domain-containing protein [Micrococcales bacterium]|nr:DivIVA domain-containing protein [Micrococcales bacterium]
MALTPEQVLNKHFQTTQFRRGYEERDVDDFLDEIVSEMRSLIEQRDDYLKQLNDCRASKNQQAIRGAADDTGRERIAKTKADAEQPAKRADGAPKAATPALDSEAPGASAEAGGDAAGVIALAQRLHDEHVANGQTQRDALIAEGTSTRDELIHAGQTKHDELVNAGQSKHEEASKAAEEMSAASVARRDQMIAEATSKRDQMIAEATSKRDQMLTEAKERSTGMVAEAEQQKASVLEGLGKQKSLIERQIQELRGFERDYRSNLKSYLQSQLATLDGNPQDPAKGGGAREQQDEKAEDQGGGSDADQAHHVGDQQAEHQG